MRIVELAHYYAAHGPTSWAIKSLELYQDIRHKDDRTLLFIDDVHDIHEVPKAERQEPVVPLPFTPDFVIYESALIPDALTLIKQLQQLPKRKRARFNRKSGKWYCGRITLTNHDGRPSCTLLDAALTLKKLKLGHEALTILPFFYEQQQKELFDLLRKLNVPAEKVTTLLYDQSGFVSQLQLQTTP